MIGSLFKNANGRWEVRNHEDVDELTSGNLVEVLMPGRGWIRGRVEYVHGAIGYLLVTGSLSNLHLQNLMPARTGRDMEQEMRRCIVRGCVTFARNGSPDVWYCEAHAPGAEEVDA